jgi:hypothetical protein
VLDRICERIVDRDAREPRRARLALRTKRVVVAERPALVADRYSPEKYLGVTSRRYRSSPVTTRRTVSRRVTVGFKMLTLDPPISAHAPITIPPLCCAQIRSI